MNFLTLSFKFLNLVGSFATVGSLLAMAFLLLDVGGKFSTSSEKLRTFLKVSALTWFIGAAGTVVLTLATILATSIQDALDLTILRSFITQITLGRYLAVQTLIALVVLFAAFKVRSVITTTFLMFVALAGITAPVFQSHAASSGSHMLVIGSLVIHVIALSLWVGGIFAIAFLSTTDRVIAVPRFSQLALWSALAVVLSGVVNAWSRLNFVGAWDSAYARVVIAKTIATIALVGLGYLHRKNLEKKSEINWIGFGRLLTVEALIMGVTVIMGTWLSSNSSPDRLGNQEFNAALSIVGINTPAEPTLSRVLLGYEPNSLIIGVLVLLVALYIKGVDRKSVV
jgi:putative copper resistance protein D